MGKRSDPSDPKIKSTRSSSKSVIKKRRPSSCLNLSTATTALMQSSRSSAELIDQLDLPFVMEKDNVFSRQLPYNTNRPGLHEAQKTTLELLRANRILNAYSFDVCIANFDRVKSAEVLDQIFWEQDGHPLTAPAEPIDWVPPVILDEDNMFSRRLPYKTNDPGVISHQKRTLELLRLRGALNEHTFDVCIVNPNVDAVNAVFDRIYFSGPRLRDLDDVDVSAVKVPPPSYSPDPRFCKPKPSAEMLAAEASVLEKEELKFPVIFCIFVM